MADKYPNFAQLKANERLGVNYRIHVENRDTPVAVIAPHGGRIEPGTSEIAAISGDTQFMMLIAYGAAWSSRTSSSANQTWPH